jgi:hypothetical protein
MQAVRTILYALLPAMLPLAAQQTRSSCDRCSASYISREEITATARATAAAAEAQRRKGQVINGGSEFGKN